MSTCRSRQATSRSEHFKEQFLCFHILVLVFTQTIRWSPTYEGTETKPDCTVMEWPPCLEGNKENPHQKKLPALDLCPSFKWHFRETQFSLAEHVSFKWRSTVLRYLLHYFYFKLQFIVWNGIYGHLLHISIHLYFSIRFTNLSLLGQLNYLET